MNIINAKDYEAMSKQGAELLIELMRKKADAIICLATGGSPKRMYEILAQAINEERIDLSHMTFVKLDEWYGLSKDDPSTCTSFLNTYFFDLLDQKKLTIIGMESDQAATQECDKMNAFLKAHTIDCMILGLGMDAHLGLNEPNDYLTLEAHHAQLNEQTKTHDMAKGKQLTSGLTIGMEGIFQAKHILMLVSGPRKEAAYQAFMSKRITTKAPCSFLWLHPHCTTIIDHTQFSD